MKSLPPSLGLVFQSKRSGIWLLLFSAGGMLIKETAGNIPHQAHKLCGEQTAQEHLEDSQAVKLFQAGVGAQGAVCPCVPTGLGPHHPWVPAPWHLPLPGPFPSLGVLPPSPQHHPPPPGTAAEPWTRRCPASHQFSQPSCGAGISWSCPLPSPWCRNASFLPPPPSHLF